MNMFKDFMQVSTDIFVRFNEQLAERMGDLKIDEKYSDELLGMVHHIRDKNELYIEATTFWNSIGEELEGTSKLSDNDTIMEALRTLKDATRKIYSRKSDEKESRSVEWLSGVENFADELTVRFHELGVRDKGRKKEAFSALTSFCEDLQKLEAGKNTGDYHLFDPLWDSFQDKLLKLD